MIAIPAGASGLEANMTSKPRGGIGEDPVGESRCSPTSATPHGFSMTTLAPKSGAHAPGSGAAELAGQNGHTWRAVKRNQLT